MADDRAIGEPEEEQTLTDRAHAAAAMEAEAVAGRTLYEIFGTFFGVPPDDRTHCKPGELTTRVRATPGGGMVEFLIEGPRGGIHEKTGLTPDVARKLAADLVDMAKRAERPACDAPFHDGPCACGWGWDRLAPFDVPGLPDGRPAS